MRITIKNPPLPEPASPAWMLSFADLLSLVLTFFVLIIATAKPIVQGSVYEQTGETIISAKTEERENKILLQVSEQDLSTNYLYKIMKEKFALDKDLASLKLTPHDNKLSISVTSNKFNQLSGKLARLIKVIDNQIWIYSANIDDSQTALILLQQNGLNKNLAIAQSHMPKGQIDIVIFP